MCVLFSRISPAVWWWVCAGGIRWTTMEKATGCLSPERYYRTAGLPFFVLCLFGLVLHMKYQSCGQKHHSKNRFCMDLENSYWFSVVYDWWFSLFWSSLLNKEYKIRASAHQDAFHQCLTNQRVPMWSCTWTWKKTSSIFKETHRALVCCFDAAHLKWLHQWDWHFCSMPGAAEDTVNSTWCKHSFTLIQWRRRW